MQHPGLYIAFWFTLQVELFSFQKRRHMSIVLAISAVIAPPFMDFFCSSRANAKISFQKLTAHYPKVTSRLASLIEQHQIQLMNAH
jgi:hypothetical protein